MVTSTARSTGLLEAGGELRWVYDPDPAKVKAFQERYPQAKEAARAFDEIFEDKEIKSGGGGGRFPPSAVLSVAACSMRARIISRTRPPFTTLAQLADAREPPSKRTGRKYMVYYSERLHVECAVFAGELIRQGAIGRV